MRSVKLSVVVPTLNNGDTLEDALRSILAQEIEGMEILCVDAGSKDDTLDVIEKLEKEDRRIRFLKARRKNCGYMLNQGMKKAAGEYIAFLPPTAHLSSGIYGKMIGLADENKLDFLQSDASPDVGLSSHRSHYGRVMDPSWEQDWTEFPGIVTCGLYRVSFLRGKDIKFGEFPGMGIPSVGFRFQAFMHGTRVYFLEEPCFESIPAEGGMTDPFALFKEYDIIGSVLRKDASLMEAHRYAYGKSCLRDVRKALPKVPAAELRAFLEKAAAYFRGLHDDGMLDYYSLEPEEHRELTEIMYNTERYAEDRLLGETPRMAMEFLFPYHLFPEGSRVAIYGAGNVGRTIYRQAIHDNYVNIVGIVDRNAEGMEETDIPAESVGNLFQMNYDYILLAIRSSKAAEGAKKALVDMGIPEGKIKWDGTAYFRDEFYRNLYFPMLRAWNENYAEHGQFLHAYETKIKGSVNDHVFPYHLFREGMKVALYGAGDIGKKYYRQATHDGYVRIAGIVDRNPAGIYAPDVPVKGIGELKSMSYDYVLITVHGGGAAKSIREDLRKLGIPENKIKWDGETYYRDEFYRNVYFPLLRKAGGDFRNRNQMMEDLQKKLRYAIYDHIFPYHLFQEGETIAIYGAGDVGRKFYQQAKDYGWVKCVVIVDKNAEKINIPGIPVAPVGALKQFSFDKVLISMTNETWANEARETLIRMGIADERIKWAGKSYWREHFYRQYWFEYLRFIHEMRRSKI